MTSLCPTCKKWRIHVHLTNLLLFHFPSLDVSFISFSQKRAYVFFYAVLTILTLSSTKLPYIQVWEAPVPDALPTHGWAAAAAGVGGVAAAGAALHLPHQTRALSHRSRAGN